MSHPYIYQSKATSYCFWAGAPYTTSPEGLKRASQSPELWEGSWEAIEASFALLKADETHIQLCRETLENYKRQIAHPPPLTLMGVLNITPDSFYDGGFYHNPEKAKDHAFCLMEEGAAMVDVGGESSRPGAEPISVEEELKRVMPVIKGLKNLPIPLSIDTTKAEVAHQALSEGVQWVNDISAGTADPRMDEVVRDHQGGYILMHMKGRPKTMQKNPHYDHLFGEITDYLYQATQRALARGIAKDKIWIDPGIGFGKTWENNYAIFSHVDFLFGLGYPVLIGGSRKSFLQRFIPGGPAQRLFGTIAAHLWAFQKGVRIFRVHDVKVHRDAFSIWDGIRNG